MPSLRAYKKREFLSVTGVRRMKKETTYEFIWTEVIEPTIKRIHASIHDDLCIKYKFCHRDLVFVKHEIFDLYEKKRDRLKTLYHFDDGTEKRLIDIHKIAACFAAVLIENPVFEYSMDVDSDLPDNMFCANAELAYSVSLGIIYIQLIGDYTRLKQEQFVKKLIETGKLVVPKTTKGHDEYHLGRVKTLVLNQVFQNDFDILTYSDMMFWIELYNRQILEQTIEPQPFRE